MSLRDGRSQRWEDRRRLEREGDEIKEILEKHEEEEEEETEHERQAEERLAKWEGRGWKGKGTRSWVETQHQKQWELRRLKNHRKGSFSSTNKKNAQANTKAYDLNLLDTFGRGK